MGINHECESSAKSGPDPDPAEPWSEPGVHPCLQSAVAQPKFEATKSQLTTFQILSRYAGRTFL